MKYKLLSILWFALKWVYCEIMAKYLPEVLNTLHVLCHFTYS